MAYAAVISLKNTIQRLLNSPHISIVSPNPEIIEFAYKELKSLEKILERLDSSNERLNALEVQTREAVCKLEDVFESQVSYQFLSQSQRLGGGSNPTLFSLDLEKVRQDINSLVQMVMKIKEEIKDEYSKEVLEPSNPLPEEEDDAVPSRIYFRPKTSSMVVGLQAEVMDVKDLLTGFSSKLEILSLVGMAGIGKTTLAGKIFTDPLIDHHFHCAAWVTIGPKYQLKEILLGILDQIDPAGKCKKLFMGEDKTKLDELIYKRLCGWRYFIILDDIWNTQIWDHLKRLFPDHDNGSRVLLTTRLEDVAKYASRSSPVLQKHFLNEEDSLNLLCKQVFGEELCPPELEKAGKKIAEKCEGLPLTIIMVADILFVSEKTPEYWNKVAEKKNSVFNDAYDQIAKVLYPSYSYLPQYLKACFLYMGVFLENYEIPPSKLIKLWVAEGFLEPNPSQTLEDFAMECLMALVSNNLVMIRKPSSNYIIKTCKLHSVFRYLSIREAGKSKFFHVLNRRVDGLVESIESQRRLCIQNNILFGIKDVYNSMASISTVRSLLCTGPHHRYPVPLCFGLSLLRVLDALAIRFYEFPIEVLKLVQLRYLALTYNGKLPSSISKLWNLQCLIVSRHLNIKSPGDWSYLPIEIWDMKELKHLQIMGPDLPDPNCGALLPNLLTLLDVSALSCTKGVLESIPNLEKLGIQIELAPDAAEPLCCFDHISHLHGLESLKCVIVNPKLKSEVLSPPAPPSMFPLGLKKLSLSGFGYPCEYMSIIASMPKLEVLKLRCCAFLGPDWETREGEFLQLKFLLLEDTNLVHWRAADDCFPLLQRLIIRHCYKLEEIPSQIGSISTLTTIEVADCNPLVVAYVQQIQEEEQSYGNDFVQFLMDSSWDHQ